MTFTDQHEQIAPVVPADELPDSDSWPVTTEGVPPQELQEAGHIGAAEAPAVQTNPDYGISDCLRGVWVGVHARLIERNWNLEKRWHNMSRNQRMLARLTTGTTVALVGVSALVLGRSSGAAATGLEDAGVLHLPDMVPLQSQPSYRQQNTLENLGTQLTLVAQTTANDAPQNDYDGQIDLKLDPNARPDTVPLGKWDKETGHGTIWNQVIEYADEMGYGDLTPRQERALVQETLDHEGLTWNRARDLPTTYEPELLTRNEMQAILNDTDAVRTHAPDLPAAPQFDDRAADVPHRDPASGTNPQAQPEARSSADTYEEVPRFPWVDWLPADNLNPRDPDWVIDNWLFRTRVDDEAAEFLLAAGVAGAVVYGTQQRRRRRRAERRLAAYERGRHATVVNTGDDEDVVVERPHRRAATTVPPVTSVSPASTVAAPAVVPRRRRVLRRIHIGDRGYTDRRIRRLFK